MTRPRPLRPLDAVAALASLAALAAPVRGQVPPPEPLTLEVHGRVLENGLVVLVAPWAGAPVIAFNMKFRVGSVNERPGQTGIAHILEHMLWKGTRTLGTTDYEAELPLLAAIASVGPALDAARREGRQDEAVRLEAELDALQGRARPYVVKEEQWSLLERHGATGLNASTSNDLTDYYYTLPSNRLELWAWMERDRLRDPVLREYYQERDTVIEERQSGVDEPLGHLWEEYEAAAFHAHPYGQPVVGWLSDIQSIGPGEVERFFRAWYAPNQAVAVAVGDVDPEEVFRTAGRYFGDLPRGDPPPPVVTVEPPQTGPRRVVVGHEGAAVPQVLVGFHRPGVGHEDTPALDVLAGLLSTGRSSRLARELVDTGLAVAASAQNPDTRYPGLFTLHAVPAAGHTVEEVESALARAVGRLREEPVGEAEMAKVLRQLRTAHLRALRDPARLADLLATYEALLGAGGWRRVLDYPGLVAAVGPEDLRRVASTYLLDELSTTAVLLPR
ncbi:MAG: insulinase family protein [Planctomycetes bacterium]|nr:insulinase family protein [Planctomycetota bacterium]